ncbi:MAG: tRNA (N(6)-L-threonylcarbamoyladenosine(37)-C(2))-methylthiotransferase MtaB [Erysipelotrichaceae bacterium]|nr:tRNA (N(6)-L-threonylcarbamoyladenosine(37)-C(2))-methylthiotransferase MtaB [Erysipelotrichaceae bacterium]
MITFAVATLGCKVNTYESEGYVQALLDKGYQEVDFKEDADVYIINTCSVTNMAASKSRQKIHQARKRNPNALLVVVGCYAQTHSEQLKEREQIDILVGSDGKSELATLIENALQNRTFQSTVQTSRSVRAFEALPVSYFHRQTRAFLKIQDGCNQFCSYCIIPYARGLERSMDIEDVMKMAKNLVANGHLEIVLSGIHIGRYGCDKGTSLLTLMKRMVEEIEGLQRIRISSIELNEVSDELLQFIKEEEKVAKHLHIPIQSANDVVLKNMNRTYTLEKLMNRIAYIHSYIPHISISSDVIVGFPMESDEQFYETMQNIEKMKLSFLHVFPYSKRDHTVAASMPGHLDNKTKKERAAKLATLSTSLYNEYKQSFMHKYVDVIFEKEENGYLFGHSSEYLPVYVKGPSSYLRKMKHVKVTDVLDDHLLAVLEEE